MLRNESKFTCKFAVVINSNYTFKPEDTEGEEQQIKTRTTFERTNTENLLKQETQRTEDCGLEVYMHLRRRHNDTQVKHIRLESGNQLDRK